MAPPRPSSAELSAVPWILRLAVAGCFIGHGAWGIITKAAWLPYFAVGGVEAPAAWQLMPWVGRMDVTVGLLVLLWPCRALFLWATVWGTWTALCRPLAGESCWEFIERAGNYGVPLALMVAVGWRGAWFARLPDRWPELTDPTRRRLGWILRAVTVAVLAGHAGCTLTESTASFRHNYVLLWPHAPLAGVYGFGLVELILALLVLVRPWPGLLVGTCLWKIGTESLFLFAHAPIWELLERFGSYLAPLALAVLLMTDRARSLPSETPVVAA